MKLRTGLMLAGIGCITVGAAAAAYVVLTDEDIKNKTKESLEDLVRSATVVAEKVKENAEDTAQKAQKVTENNIKWSQEQWDKIVGKA